MDEAKLAEIEARIPSAATQCMWCDRLATLRCKGCGGLLCDEHRDYLRDESPCGGDAPEPVTHDHATADRTDLVAEVRRLTAALGALRSHLCNVLGWAYEPCDQTVRCPQCEQVWWDQPEAINENWHAAGCEIFAAEVASGRSVDVRRGVACEKRHHLEGGSPPVEGAAVAVSGGPDLPLDAPGGGS